MPIPPHWLDLPVSDGTSMRAFAALPDSPAAPGIVLFQEIFGVNGHIREVAQRLAGEGFAIVAPEVFHRTAPGFDTPYGDYTPGRAEAAKMILAGFEADAAACLAWLRGRGSRKVGCVGFCLGGRLAFWANTGLAFDAAASFYGGRMDEHLDRAGNLQGPHLFLWGGKDTIIPEDQRNRVMAAVRDAGKPHIEITFGEADHGFFCDQRPSHHAESARLAWPLLLAFLREHLG